MRRTHRTITSGHPGERFTNRPIYWHRSTFAAWTVRVWMCARSGHTTTGSMVTWGSGRRRAIHNLNEMPEASTSVSRIHLFELTSGRELLPLSLSRPNFSSNPCGMMSASIRRIFFQCYSIDPFPECTRAVSSNEKLRLTNRVLNRYARRVVSNRSA